MLSRSPSIVLPSAATVQHLALAWRLRREILTEYAAQRRELTEAVILSSEAQKPVAEAPAGSLHVYAQACNVEKIRRRMWPDLLTYANTIDARCHIYAWQCYKNIVSAVRQEVETQLAGGDRYSASTICDDGRAVAIGVQSRSYAAQWRVVYEWAYRRCMKHLSN